MNFVNLVLSYSKNKTRREKLTTLAKYRTCKNQHYANKTLCVKFSPKKKDNLWESDTYAKLIKKQYVQKRC